MVLSYDREGLYDRHFYHFYRPSFRASIRVFWQSAEEGRDETSTQT